MKNAKYNVYNSSLAPRLKNILVIVFITFGLFGCADKSAQEYVDEAQAFVEQGDNNAAIVVLKNAIQQEPRNPTPRFVLGEVYLSQRNFESAEKELSRALELGYSAKDVIPMLAQALQRSGANVALSEIDTTVADLTPDEELEVGFRKLQSLMLLNNTLQAQSLLNELRTIDSQTVYKGLIDGYQLVLNKDFKGALDVANSIYERAPTNRDVLTFSARMNTLNGKPEVAADIYENYIKVAPEDIETKFSLASMLVAQRQPERAEKHIDELLEINANNPLLNQLKGVVRAAADDFENAKLYSEKAIAGGRTDPTLRLVAGLASYKLDDYEAAAGHLSIIASLLPDNHPGLRILAASQLQANMGDDAGEILNRVNDISPQDASLFSRAGYELLKSGNTSAARTIIEQAEKISESAEDLTRLGVLKLSINDIEGLIDLESAVAKAPASATAKTTLASAYLSTNQLDKALDLAKQWQQEAPAKVDAYLLESEIHQRQEQYALALDAIDRAAQVDASNPVIDIAKIRLDLRQDKFDEALVKTEALLEREPANLNGLASYLALKAKNKEPEQGLERVKAIVAKDPSNINLRLLLARASLSFGKVNETIAALKPIKADRNAPAVYWPLKGMALLRSNQLDLAFDHYALWSEYFPSIENAVIGQLVILDNKREYAKAARIAKEFLANKESIQVKLMESYFLVSSGDAKGAKRILASIDERFLDVPFMRGVQAKIAISENRASEAVEDAIAAYNANKNGNNLLLVIISLEASDKKDAAFDVLSTHVQAFPNDMQAHMLFAERQIQTDPEGAVATYEIVLKSFPNNFMVLNNIAYLEMQAGNLDKAAKHGRRAYEIEPNNAATADTYAQILIKQDKLEDAVKAYNRVMSDGVTNEEIFLNYLEALWMSGSDRIAERRMADLELKQEKSIKRLEELKAKYTK